MDEAAEERTQLEETGKKLRALPGMSTISRDQLGSYASAVEEEEERLAAYEAEVRRARTRLAAGAYTDRWQRAADEAAVEVYEQERPKAKACEMVRDMMTNREEREEQRRQQERAAAAEANGGPAETQSGVPSAGRESRAAVVSGAPAVEVAGAAEAAGAAMPAALTPPPPPPSLPPVHPPRASGVTWPPASELSDLDAELAAELASRPVGERNLEAEVAVRLGRAAACKEEGNAHFQALDDPAALVSYRRALHCLHVPVGAAAAKGGDGALTPTAEEEAVATLARQRGLSLIVSLHCNRSAALLRCGEPAAARLAASAAIALAPTDVKARRRRAAALNALGEHSAACADLVCAWRRAPRGGDLSKALAEAWCARAPELRMYLARALARALDATGVASTVASASDTDAAVLTTAAGAAASGATASALCRALVGGVKARAWAAEYEGSGAAEALACDEVIWMFRAAATAAKAADYDGAVALLRAVSWVVCLPGTEAAEKAIVDGLLKPFTILADEKAISSDAVIVGALQVVQAMCIKRPANCAWMPESSVLKLYKEGRSGAIRAAAEGCLVWLSRHPHTNAWMNSLAQVRAEPLILRCRSLHGACQIGRRGFDEGTGWAFRPHELAATERETRLFPGDGESTI